MLDLRSIDARQKTVSKFLSTFPKGFSLDNNKIPFRSGLVSIYFYLVKNIPSKFFIGAHLVFFKLRYFVFIFLQTSILVS